mgnify:FL=1
MVKSGDNINKEVSLAGAVQSGDSPVAEPAKKSSGGRLLKVGQVVMGVVLVLTLVAIGICAFTDLDDQLGNYLAYSKYNIKSERDASKLIYEGHEKAAIWWYEGQIKQTKDKQKQAKLYLELAMYLNALVRDNKTRYNLALKYASKAEELVHNSDSAGALAEVYNKVNDQGNYTKYLQLSNERRSKEGKNSGDKNGVSAS